MQVASFLGTSQQGLLGRFFGKCHFHSRFVLRTPVIHLSACFKHGHSKLGCHMQDMIDFIFFDIVRTTPCWVLMTLNLLVDCLNAATVGRLRCNSALLLMTLLLLVVFMLNSRFQSRQN